MVSLAAVMLQWVQHATHFEPLLWRLHRGSSVQHGVAGNKGIVLICLKIHGTCRPTLLLL